MRALRLLTPARSLPSKPCRISSNLFSSSSSAPASESNEAETDNDDVIPRKPTWSVHELISSYPRPHISNTTLKKLHQLSALVPPAEGTPEHERIRRELEEMVRLVEAVKLVDTSSVDANEIPDGRIWPEGVGMALTSNGAEREFDGEDGETGLDLLKYASTTKNGLYMVEADRRKKGNQ